MAASTITIDWDALAKTLWHRAQITGHGPHAVVNRCFFPHTDVRLFETEAAARGYESALCSPTCARKHTYGSIERFAPQPPMKEAPSARITYRRNSSLLRMMLSED